MELVFQPKTVDYLRNLVRDVKNQEETLETVVPDSYPDIDRILSTDATVVMRSKECRGGCVTVAGGIRGNVLYLAEGESAPRNLEVYLPFSVKAEKPGLSENSQIVFFAFPRSTDARMLGSRKVQFRASVGYDLAVYTPETLEIPELREKPEELQLRTEQYPIRLPLETAERSFQLSEEIAIPAQKPLGDAVYAFTPRLEVTESRIAGSKAVFKGSASVRTLYRAEDGSIAQSETQFPFSQYCELRNVYESGEELQIVLMPTGCDCERSMMQDGNGLVLTMQVLAQCIVTGLRTVTVQEDAYCVGARLEAEWQEIPVTGLLDVQHPGFSVREYSDIPAREVVDVQVFADHPELLRSGAETEITVPACARVLYRDPEGKLQSAAVRTRSVGKMPGAENAACTACAFVQGGVSAVPSGSGLEVRYVLGTDVESRAELTLHTLSGGKIVPAAESGSEKPAFIARRLRRGETLWEAAKSIGTSVELIRSANPGETDGSDTVLLIPVL